MLFFLFKHPTINQRPFTRLLFCMHVQPPRPSNMGNSESPHFSRVLEYLCKDHSTTALVKILRALYAGQWFKSIEESHWYDERGEIVHKPYSNYRILLFSEESRSDVEVIFKHWEDALFDKLQVYDDDNNPSVAGMCLWNTHMII